MNLELIRNHQINKLNWNRCINESFNGMPYAYSWYLDEVAKDTWGALVYSGKSNLGYKAVFPLFIRRNYYGEYINYNPFVMDVDLYTSSDALRQEYLPIFLKEIQKRFKYIGKLVLAPDENNRMVEGEKIRKYGIGLNYNYTEIYENYSADRKRNLQKALKYNKIEESVDLETLLSQFQILIQPKLHYKTPYNTFEIQRKLYGMLLKNGMLKIFAAKVDGKLAGMISIIIGKNRILTNLSFANAIGKKHSSATALYDYLIRKFANKPLFLDSNSASSDGLQYFKQSLGYLPIDSKIIRQNDLPIIIRKLIQLRRSVLQKLG
jgi:hypothetical protein